MTTASTRNTIQLHVTVAITKRGLMRMRRLPSLMIPSIVMPIFFVVAFSGSFSSVVQLDGYSTDKAVNWMAAWAILQGSAFSGLGGGGLGGGGEGAAVAQSCPIHPVLQVQLKYSFVVKLKRADFVLFSSQPTGRN